MSQEAINSGEVVAGPGLIWVGPVGTAEPTSATAVLDASFRQVGYTKAGTTVKYQITSSEIEVAEEFDPIRYQTTKREGSVSFEMAQASIANLALALNQGSAVDNTQGSIEPPAVGSELRVMIVLQTQDGARWIFRQCLNASDLSVAFKKAPDYTTYPVEFKLEKPTGNQPFKVFPSLTAGVTGLVS